MNLSGLTYVPAFQFPFSRRLGGDPGGRKRIDALTAELQAALARETALRDLNAGLSQHHDLMVLEFKMMALEFEQRFVNGLQCIAALLSLQSRIAAPEAAAQLSIAARRVAAFGRVHQRLHFVDHRRTVEFSQYLRLLCEDISGLLFQDRRSCLSIVVDGTLCEIPTATAIPLGLIVNELVTNAGKHAHSNITVRIETTLADNHSLSVIDDGPGLSAAFDPSRSAGLGMKLVLLLVQQIGATLHIASSDNGGGARFTVAFCCPSSGSEGAQALQ